MVPNSAVTSNSSRVDAEEGLLANKGVFVSTGCHEASGEVFIKIKDEGIGMNRNIRNKITDPFFTTKRDIGGTGLGLSVSSKIVNNHGGTLYFKSEPGQGTEASVVLPVEYEIKEE